MARIIGTICLALAALVYLVPVQVLLLELARKRDDGGGAFAGILLFGALWVLLAIALCCAVAEGGFDRLGMARVWQYLLVVFASLCFLVLALARLEFARHPGKAVRLLTVAFVHVPPLLSMLLVVITLYPRFAFGVAHTAVLLPWAVCAAGAVLLGAGFLGCRLVGAGGGQLAGLVHRAGHKREVRAQNLASIPTLDPKRDFSELIRFTDEWNSDEVRAAAIARLRTDGGFVAALIAELDGGQAGQALATLEIAGLAPDEQQRVGPHARRAIERITQNARREWRHIPKDRRQRMRSAFKRLLPAVQRALPAANVDLQPAIAAFDDLFDHPERITP
ncbi:hypothetical protein [Piscinibacter sp.]|uniref:hypothetical protein n=1 Tax=Piscinibacter sp. TaxID=1903157 RepID=UPI0039E4D18C